MSGHEYELVARRVDKITQNTECKPVDLLKALIYDIETGRLQIDGVMILSAFRPDGSPWSFDTFRAGLTRADEFAFLTLAEHRAVRCWRTDTDDSS